MSEKFDIGFRRCRSGSGDYWFFRRRGLSGFLRRDEFADPAELTGVLENFSRLPQSELLKNSASARIGCFGGYFIKRYNFRSFPYAIKRLFRPVRPCRCLKAALRLRELGVATPEIFAAVRRRRFGFLPEVDFLVTELLPPDSRSLTIVLAEAGEPDPRLIRDLIRLLARLHAAGFEHGDLNIRNLYLLSPVREATHEFGLIDLDGVRLSSSPLDRRHRRKELARLVSSVFRCRREQLAKNPDFDRLIRPYCTEYLKASGINLCDAKLKQRVRYLFHRIRCK